MIRPVEPLIYVVTPEKGPELALEATETTFQETVLDSEGKVIVDFLNREMPAYLDTGLNWVHVRDVVIGHILAAERGEIGERYILGNAAGNWTMMVRACCGKRPNCSKSV
jgi:hypothetical protein